MKIAIGGDHRGFKVKSCLIEFLKSKGHDVTDVGTYTTESTDYPIYAQKVAEAISSEAAEKGILICGSGIGVCMAVNKFKGIRGATVRSPKEAYMSVLHNNANVLCMGADFTSSGKAKKITEKFLSAEFEGGRHQRRLDIIKGFEEKR
jgi:ribose 5-phosphate isomerase B